MYSRAESDSVSGVEDCCVWRGSEGVESFIGVGMYIISVDIQRD